MFSYLQKIGRALMIPVAILPAAAILMGIGYWIDPVGWGADNTLAALLIKSGAAILDQMPLLFAVGVAFGMSKDKNGSAALTGLVGFLVVTSLLAPATVALLQNIELSEVNAAFGKINNQFIGILVGVIGAELYNRFSSVQLHKALSFFSGKRLVPIIMSFTMILLSFILLYVWPVIYSALVKFGAGVGDLGAVGAGIFGFSNRILIPFGLHHALNSVFWFDVAGINDIPNFLGGAKTIAEQGEAVKGVVGMYQAGFFPIMMGGLLGGALAFVKTAKRRNRETVTSVMIAAGFASFFTGVTEPLEFAFMFLAPSLYVLHAIFTGLSLFIAAKMEWMAGFGFSAGLVDLILSTRNPLAVNWWMLILQGVFFFALYYFSFSFIIKKWKLKTPGREDRTKPKPIEPLPEGVVFDNPHAETAARILPLLGGKSNIVAIDNCITRLRLDVKNSALVNTEVLNSLVSGVIVPSATAVQVVIGTDVEFVAKEFRKVVASEAPEIVEKEPQLKKEDFFRETAMSILPLVGGKGNIIEVNNCTTRLRLELKDSTLVQKTALKAIIPGVITPNSQSAQLIIGLDVEFVTAEFRKLL